MAYRTLKGKALKEVQEAAAALDPDGEVIESLEREHATLVAMPKSKRVDAQIARDERVTEIEAILLTYGVKL